MFEVQDYMKNVDVGWGIVSACNMKCKFCYSADVRQEIRNANVGIKDWISFVDRNSENIDSINYGTGENSLLDDWYEFVSYVSKNYPDIKQAITTNGTMYEMMMANPKYEKIVNEGIAEVDVSLDFFDEHKHDDLRELKGAFQNATSMLKYCKNTDIEATLVFIAINDVIQIDNLQGLFGFAKEVDCKLRTNIFRPMNIKDERIRSFVASYDSILRMLKWINENHSILYLGDPLFSSILTTGAAASDPSGVKSVRILSNGDITPSTYLINKEFRKVNIKDALLEELDHDNMGMDLHIPDKCDGCKYRERCRGGVLDRRYLWYGTFNEADPYCPLREENYEPDFKVEINPNNEKIVSVHKDYLPTMFFKA